MVVLVVNGGPSCLEAMGTESLGFPGLTRGLRPEFGGNRAATKGSETLHTEYIGMI